MKIILAYEQTANGKVPRLKEFEGTPKEFESILKLNLVAVK